MEQFRALLREEMQRCHDDAVKGARRPGLACADESYLLQAYCQLYREHIDWKDEVRKWLP